MGEPRQAERVPEWTLGDRLAKARRAAGIDQQTMADLLLRGKNTMSNWENDRTRPTRKLLVRWAELTDVPLWWLADERPPSNGRRRTSTKWPTATRRVVVALPQVAAEIQWAA